MAPGRRGEHFPGTRHALDQPEVTRRHPPWESRQPRQRRPPGGGAAAVHITGAPPAVRAVLSLTPTGWGCQSKAPRPRPPRAAAQAVDPDSLHLHTTRPGAGEARAASQESRALLGAAAARRAAWRGSGPGRASTSD